MVLFWAILGYASLKRARIGIYRTLVSQCSSGSESLTQAERWTGSTLARANGIFLADGRGLQPVPERGLAAMKKPGAQGFPGSAVMIFDNSCSKDLAMK